MASAPRLWQHSHDGRVYDDRVEGWKSESGAVDVGLVFDIDHNCYHNVGHSIHSWVAEDLVHIG